VLDFAGGVEKLIALYENDFLNQAQLEKSKREGSTIVCPKCNAENSDKARRCIGVDHKNIRCDHFWISQECRKCGTQNDVTAQECRSCHEQLRDPNEKLLHKAYTDSELVAVDDMQLEPTKNGGILIRFILADGEPDHGYPVEFYAPNGSETARRVWYNNFVKIHCNGSKFQSQMYNMRTAPAIMKMKAVFDKPTHIAYRLNSKGKFVIGRRKFSSGRTVGEKGQE
jgi:ribosomal protein L40E